ncbi:Gfo/Idh/MocA family oxidoreductase [Rhodopirellula sp.]|jgi:predicted dehydrogenase|nr:Gfo/Idh/MocA family oxidoreductase [Rhodopirellula sp.]
MKPNQQSPAPSEVSRRQFHRQLGGTLGALSGFHFFPALADKKLEKPTVAGIGIGGKGASDLAGAKNAGFEIVAHVDVFDTKRFSSDDRRVRRIAESRNNDSHASFFTDYREMLIEMGDKVDAVTVSTPDHHHYHASAMAMKAGKHVYCQKPLTHGIWEARSLKEIAAATGVKTQMGNQAHAKDHMRRCVELLRAGIIGPIKEIHAWTNRPIWPQGFSSPPTAQKVPDGIDWDQWIGPAPWVDYSPQIAPFAWRGWWNYGTGALGDMACHIMDMGYWAMQSLTNQPLAPSQVSARQQGATDFSPPINSIISWDFAPTRYSSRDGFTFHWYDGYINAKFDRNSWQLKKESDEYNHPDDDVLEGMSFQNFGSVIIGEEGKLFFNRSNKKWVLKSKNSKDSFASVDQSIPRAREEDSYKEWIDAISGVVNESESNFAQAGPLTETILLGVLAQRCPNEKLLWNHDEMIIEDRPELSRWIKREYRDGWSS